jgi:uncharacterized protein YkwD
LAKTRLLLAAALASVLIAVTPPPRADAGQRKQMIRAINFVRGWGHHHRLHFSPRLSRAASRWAHSLMRRDVLAHSSAGYGEILEWHTGRRGRVNRTVMSWLGSPGHARVMLSDRFRRAGAGKAVGFMNGQRSVIWVVRFAR